MAVARGTVILMCSN